MESRTSRSTGPCRWLRRSRARGRSPASTTRGRRRWRFSRSRPPSRAAIGNLPPEREPDQVVESPTLPQQALLYRLCGDKNPLHADPEFAKMGGFDTPILHGLCSFGAVCKAVVDKALDGDTTKVTRYQARFAGVVFPGETIVTSLWKEGDKILVNAKTKERDTPVITNSAITISA
jgi:acyl dehydratase